MADKKPIRLRSGHDNKPSLLVSAVLATLLVVSYSPATAQPFCVGDCNDDASVTVDELLTMVNVALGAGNVAACTEGDANSDSQITVDEILAAVNMALNSCPAAQLTAEGQLWAEKIIDHSLKIARG